MKKKNLFGNEVSLPWGSAQDHFCKITYRFIIITTIYYLLQKHLRLNIMNQGVIGESIRKMTVIDETG